MINKAIFTTLTVLVHYNIVVAQTATDSTADSRFTFHAQMTIVTQHNFPFAVKYSGANSFENTANTETSITSTLFAGVRLWRGASVYINPEISGGAGLSSTLGVGGFPNGETFRVGDPKPAIYLARGYVQQYFNIGSNDTEQQDDDANSVKIRIPKKYIRVSAGKFSMADFFDVNDYAHDARTMFLNWGLMSHGAWDYPANTKGYTYGGIVEYSDGKQAARAAISMLPTDANGPDLDDNLANSRSITVEYERKFTFLGAPTRATVTAFHSTTHMGNYAEAVLRPDRDVTATRADGRTKYGFGVSFEREWAKNKFLFIKGSWNDGQNETWAFTEIDRSFTVGASIQGEKWKRPDDRVGVAYLTNGISAQHAAYLKAGGYGFIIGDGDLNYAQEHIIEAYYSVQVTKWCAVSPDFQLIFNPAYNADRGVVPLVALRLHTFM